MRIAGDGHEAQVQRLLVPGYQQLVADRGRLGEYNLRGDLYDPCCALGGVTVLLPVPTILANVLGHDESRLPGASSLQVRLELRDALLLGRFDLLVRVEGGRVCCDMDGVGPVEIGSAQRNRRCVAYPYV